MDIDGASALGDFELIEIFDDKNPYPVFFGIDWATDMKGVINLKKRKIIFKKKSLRVIIPLDPAKGSRYTELVHDYESDDDLDCIYKITTRGQVSVNPIANGQITWEHESSRISDSDEEIECWQNRLHEATTLNCNLMTQ